MKKSGWLTRGLVIIFSIVFIFLLVYNLLRNENFFEASATTLITIFSAVAISYFLVQKKTDIRRKNEKIDDLLYKIQGYINDEGFIVGGEKSRKNLILHRSISNKIRFLLAQKLDKDIEKEVKKLDENFKEFRSLYGENYVNEEDMKQEYNQFQNYISKMDDICDRIHMILL